MDSRFQLTRAQAEGLAAEFGTPLYVLDEASLRARIRRYQAAFAAVADRSQLTYASKANSTLALLAIVADEGVLIDCASQGELEAALRAGVPAHRCHLHGNNKSKQELEAAIECGVHEIVVDNFAELEQIADLSRRPGRSPRGDLDKAHATELGSTGKGAAPGRAAGDLPDLLLRLAPGVNPLTNAKISTGQEDTKFGFNIGDGSARRALQKALDAGLPIKGIHCHVGSQLLDPEAQRGAGAALARFARQMHAEFGWTCEVLNAGGGLGIRYTEQSPMPIEEYCRLLVGAIHEELQGSGLDPILVQEPGRSLVAESGVTLYTVGNIKRTPGRTFVSVDGGLSDNPRPALYDARYEVLDFHEAGDRQTVTVSGKHCETDQLFDGISLSSAIKPGDLLQVLCTGAYNSSMASNYNRYPRPATALLRSSGDFLLVQRRETWDEMFARETVPPDLLK